MTFDLFDSERNYTTLILLRITLSIDLVLYILSNFILQSQLDSISSLDIMLLDLI